MIQKERQRLTASHWLVVLVHALEGRRQTVDFFCWFLMPEGCGRIGLTHEYFVLRGLLSGPLCVYDRVRSPVYALRKGFVVVPLLHTVTKNIDVYKRQVLAMKRFM